MLRISEWLPNPKGPDAPGEWIEIENNSDAQASLDGWRLASGKREGLTLSGPVPARGFLVLKRKDFGFALINANGELILRDASGRTSDTAKFFGAAPEGQSFSRFGERFEFTEPTPGRANQPVLAAAISRPVFAFGEPLAPKPSNWDILYLSIAAGILLTAWAYYLVRYDPLQNIFLSGDRGGGEGAG